MNETYDSPPLDRSIFARRVPGISNGELVEALQRGERTARDEPTVNDAFSRTSPEIYQHYQNATGAQAPAYGNVLAQPQNAANTPATTNRVQGEPPLAVHNEFAALQRRLLDVDASVREYHAKEMVRHGQVLETLEQVQSQAKMYVWVLSLIGAIVIGLVILLLCMVSKVSYGLSVRAATTTATARTKAQPLASTESQSSQVFGM